jgi:ribosomal protein S18 acetylase RimI-like enzyme
MLEMDENFDELEIIQGATRLENIAAFCSLPSQVSGMHVFVMKANELSLRIKLRIMALVEENMKSFYERSSWGWNEAEMHKETLHSLNRVLLLSSSGSINDIETNLVGFAIFRFDWDDEDEPEYPVLYLYQLQVLTNFQKMGFGQAIMEMIMQISEKTLMRKVLLTCFKINVAAMQFYKKIGFRIDSNSPSQCGYEGECYEILSNKGNK